MALQSGDPRPLSESKLDLAAFVMQENAEFLGVAAQAIMDRLLALRVRCQRQTNSVVTPMGDEMFYRYQQSLIDEAATTLAALLPRVRHPHA